MSIKTFNWTVAVIFALIALLHLARIIYGWEANINGRDMPMWASYIALILSLVLAYHSFKFRKS